MSNKMICPVCGAGEVLSFPDGTFACNSEYCKSYEETDTTTYNLLIQSQKDLEESQQATLENAQTILEIHKDLEQSEKCCSAWETQALDYKAETIALSGKLEIATKALKEIKKVCDGCRWCDSNLYDPTPSDGRRIAETTNKALEQIEHKEQHLSA